MGHTRSPPGKFRPGARRALFLMACDTFTGVMLPVEPGRILALRPGRGQPRIALDQSSVRVDKTGGKVLDSPCFIGFGTLRGLGSTAGILRRFHAAFPLS